MTSKYPDADTAVLIMRTFSILKNYDSERLAMNTFVPVLPLVHHLSQKLDFEHSGIFATEIEDSKW
jgi:hypothetical protein